MDHLSRLIQKNYAHEKKATQKPILFSLSFSLFLTLFLGFLNFSLPLSLENSLGLTLDKFVVKTQMKQQINLENSPLQLQKILRPSSRDLLNLSSRFDWAMDVDFAGLFSEMPTFYFSDQQINGLIFKPVLKFSPEVIQNQTIEGTYQTELASQIVLNRPAYELLLAQGWLNKYPLWLDFNQTVRYSINNYPPQEDTFRFQIPLFVSCVIQESFILPEPCIYYEYPFLKSVLLKTPCESLTTLLNQEANWYELLSLVNHDDPLSNFQALLFLKSYQDFQVLNKIAPSFDLESPHFTFSNAYFEKKVFLSQLELLLSLATTFSLILIWIGSLFIIFFLNYSLFLSRRMDYALLLNFGFEKKGLLTLFNHEQIGYLLKAWLYGGVVLIGFTYLLNFAALKFLHLNTVLDLTLGFHNKTLKIFFVFFFDGLLLFILLLNKGLFQHLAFQNQAKELKGE